MNLQNRTPRQHGAKKPQGAKKSNSGGGMHGQPAACQGAVGVKGGLTKMAATAKKNAGKADVGKPSAGGGGCGGIRRDGNLDKPTAQGTLGATHGHLRGKPAAKGTGEKPAAQGTASSKVGHHPHAAAMSAANAFAKKTVACNLPGSTSAAAGHFAARGHAPSQAHAC